MKTVLDRDSLVVQEQISQRSKHQEQQLQYKARAAEVKAELELAKFRLEMADREAEREERRLERADMTRLVSFALLLRLSLLGCAYSTFFF